jgi:hypothetical protein
MSQVIIDFISTNYFVVVYGITWLISVFMYRKYFDTVLKYFPIIISYTFFSELLGSLVINYEDIQLIFGYDNHTFYNNLIYNIYHLSFFLFFFYVYRKSLLNASKKRIIKYGTYLFIIINLINLIIQNVLIESLVYAYLFGTILLIYCTLNYFKDVFKDNNLHILKYSLLFWVSLGLFVFHITYLPLKIFKEFYLYELYVPLRQFHLSVIVLMYVLFSIGFVISKRRAFR